MVTRRYILVILVLLGIASCCIPAGAVLLQYTHRGVVTAVDPSQGTVTIYATHRWSCTWEDGTPACGWTEISPLLLTGTVPDPAVFGVIRRGSMVESSSLGIPGGSWMGLGLLKTVFPGGGFVVTDLFGDPGSLPVPLAGAYAVTTATVPDCAACSGSRCPALAAEVSISRAGEEVFGKVLLPGEACQYLNGTYQSGVSVTFVRGQASSQLCPDIQKPITGLQPISVFVIHVDEPAALPTTPWLAERPGFLAVSSFPPGATVYLDGDIAGTTLCTIPDLAPGMYEVRIEKDGYQAWSDAVTVDPGTFSRVNARLQPLFGSLRIFTFPAGAEIAVDGIDRGVSPLVLDDLSPGIHAVNASLAGYQQREAMVTIRAGQTSAVTLRLG